MLLESKPSSPVPHSTLVGPYGTTEFSILERSIPSSSSNPRLAQSRSSLRHERFTQTMLISVNRESRKTHCSKTPSRGIKVKTSILESACIRTRRRSPCLLTVLSPSRRCITLVMTNIKPMIVMFFNKLKIGYRTATKVFSSYPIT